MKGYFDSIKKGIDKSMINVSVKSANMLEVNKIKGYIAMLEDKKESMTNSMGSEVYNLYVKDELSLAKIEALCSQIKEVDIQIMEKEKEVEAIIKEEEAILNKADKEDENICDCGEKIAKNAKFCIGCGKKLEEVRFCQCGEEIVEGAKFCIKCGSEI